MRILHVTDCYLPRLGGIEMHVRDLADRQRRIGIDAHVVTPTPGHDTEDPDWVTRSAGSGPFAPWAGGDDVVVHAHVSVWSPFATRAVHAAARAGVPVAVTVHSQWNHLAPLPTIATALLGLRCWPVAWSSVSDRAAQPMREALGPAVPVHVVPNAVDETWWRQAVAQPTGIPTVVSVMRFARTKRPLALARMLRGVRRLLPRETDLRAVVIGDGALQARTREFVARHGMDSWVWLPGRLTREEIRAELARASVFVAPASLESFGIAALEARCVGLPVIASDRSGVGEFVTSGVNGLLSGSDRGMTEAMARLLTDSETRAAMVRHNREFPSGHDWPAALGAVEELYGHACALAGTSRGRQRLSLPAPGAAR